MINNIYAMEEESLNKYLSIIDKENITEAVTSYAGIRGNNPLVEYFGSVALISVSGVITRNLDIMSYLFSSGSASMEELSKVFQACIDNNEIKSIVFDFDTPGGAVTGVNEFAEQIYNARGIKPIKAYVTGMAASAGYYIASACDEIILDEMAQVGSIGVMKSVYKKANNITNFISSQSPLKNIDAESDIGKIEYQSKVDYMAKIFISKVARNRNMSCDEVINKGNKGGLLVGAQAVSNGMADRVLSLDNLLKELNYKEQNKMNENEMKESTKSANPDFNLEEVQNQVLMQERERVSSIMAINVLGCEAIKNEAIKNGDSLQEVHAKIVAFMENKQLEQARVTSDNKVEAIEPVIAVDMEVAQASEEAKHVGAMLELAKSFEKNVR